MPLWGSLVWSTGCHRECLYHQKTSAEQINRREWVSEYLEVSHRHYCLTWTSCSGRAYCTNCCSNNFCFVIKTSLFWLTIRPTFGSSWVSKFLARLQTEGLLMMTFFFFFFHLLCLYDWLRATSRNSKLAHITREQPLQCISLGLSIYLSDCWHNLWREWKIKSALQ